MKTKKISQLKLEKEECSIVIESICWTNCTSFEEAEVIVLGVPDESKSHALRKGTNEAPQHIRRISNIRDSYKRSKKKSLGLPYNNISARIYDYGDVDKKEIDSVYDKILSSGKIPILIGGDHSITVKAVESISKKVGQISMVYFDAHPDFVSTRRNYYGSVFTDILQYIDLSSSVQIGIRTPEKEEIENLNKHKIKVITPFEIMENGVKKVSEDILSLLGEHTYISFDMDCIDPAYAPGVSVPVPLGLRSVEATYILKKIVEHGMVAMDLMEVCPPYDIKDRTSHLASRIVGETISALLSK